MVEVLREGYRIPFLRPPPLSAEPIPMPFVCLYFHQRGCARGGHPGFDCQGCCGVCLLFCLPAFTAPCLWFGRPRGRGDRSSTCLSSIASVDVSHFRMETIQSVLLSVRQGDWMASIDLQEAYLQVPVHQESRRFLRFVAHGRTYQFKALCFGLSTAPQVFTRGYGSCVRYSSFFGYWHM